MAIACKLEDYMAQHGVRYDIIAHPHSHNSMETAQLAHVRGDRVAKSVVLKDGGGFLMAVLPSTCHLHVEMLSRELNRDLRLATEDELPALFTDCEIGAIPAVGLAYGVPTVVDESLAEQPEIFFEAGDHEQLIRVNRESFKALMDRAPHARFAVHF